MRFEDKVVIVTGASSGIGEGVAKKFLAEGAYVVGCGIEPAMKIQDEKAIYVQADLTKPEQALHVVEEAVKTYAVSTSWSAVQALLSSVLWITPSMIRL